MSIVPGERIIELVLEIVLEAMKGQSPEQREKMWGRYIEDSEKWREFWAKLFGSKEKTDAPS